jgi:chemotaxis protein CheY-P-specific phosphatase CheC
MYTEMGNILASQLCRNLTEQEKSEMMISPPIQLQSHQLIRLASQHTGARRIYSHTFLQNGIEKSTDVETWTVPITTNFNLFSTNLGTNSGTALGEQFGNV